MLYAWAFVFLGWGKMQYVVYIDEFGHIGPYISRDDPKHNDSPVFGLAGYIIPASQIRSFGTWFFNRKCQLLSWEIEQSGEHPAIWEKKGSALYTVKNMTKYPEIIRTMHRILNKIQKIGGNIVYVGVEKRKIADDNNSDGLYTGLLNELIKRLNNFCAELEDKDARFLLIMDEHELREKLLTRVAQQMYNKSDPRPHLIEPPFQAESHRYQTIQAADWIAALIGRIGAYDASPDEYAENKIFKDNFQIKLNVVSTRSSIRRKQR